MGKMIVFFAENLRRFMSEENDVDADAWLTVEVVCVCIQRNAPVKFVDAYRV